MLQVHKLLLNIGDPIAQVYILKVWFYVWANLSLFLFIFVLFILQWTTASFDLPPEGNA